MLEGEVDDARDLAVLGTTRVVFIVGEQAELRAVGLREVDLGGLGRLEGARTGHQVCSFRAARARS